MKIYTLKYGESIYGENYIFKGGDAKSLLPISFTIYLIQDEEKNILVDVGCDDGAGFVMSVFKKPVEVLKEAGFDPSDVTDVVITHSHHDHVEALHYYKNATIHIQKDEFEDAKRYFSEDMHMALFDDEKSITQNVKVLKIAGHSKGSSIVIANNFVLCGDECYYRTNLEKKIPTGASINPQKSLEFVEKYSSPEYTPLLFHAPDIMEGQVGFEIVK